MNFVYLAGIGNSEPEHWQSIWCRSTPDSRWLEHADWDHPVCEQWGSELDATLRGIVGPTVLVAHSLGCLLAVDWAERKPHPNVVGAFLVAVPDAQGPAFPKEAVGFRAAVEMRLTIPAVMVASTNDPYGTIDHAQRVAAAWKIELLSLGDLGHINLKSNLGDWPQGRRLLDGFVAGLPTARVGSRSAVEGR